jgi:hypothetical protein
MACRVSDHTALDVLALDVLWCEHGVWVRVVHGLPWRVIACGSMS